MFASRAITGAQTGHRFVPSAKFSNIRQSANDRAEQYRLAELEEETHPKRSLAFALFTTLFCPILGIFALYYATRAVRAHYQGFYAESTTFYKQAIRWSLISFIFGLLIGSLIGLMIFVKLVLFV